MDEKKEDEKKRKEAEAAGKAKELTKENEDKEAAENELKNPKTKQSTK
jgi:hypothetical protein